MAVLAGLMSLFALASCDPKEEKGDPFITINGETEYNLKAEKSSFTVNISTNRDWSVRMSDAAAEWVVVSPNGGQAAENGVDITVSVLENTAGNRTAAIELYTGTATATLTVNQEGPDGDSGSETIGKPEGNGTKESPYNVSAALTLIANGKYSADDEVYVKGQISKVEEVSTKFGNATYNIVDKDYADDTLIVYRGYYLGGEKFTSEDQIKVGDEVVVLGKLTLFYEKSELTQGNQLVSLNGKEAEEQPEVETKDATIGEILSSGETGNYRIQNATVIDVTSAGKFIANDGTGSIYVYKSKHGVAVGDVVTLTGSVELYSDVTWEVNGPEIEKTGTAAVTYPEAEVWGAEQIEAYFATTPVTVKYVTVSGDVKKDGNYYKLNVSGLSEETSVAFLSLYTTTFDLSEYEGKAVKITGHAYNINNSKKFVELSVVEIEVDEASDYVSVDPASLTWDKSDLAARTVTVDASGAFTVEADEASFTDGKVWAKCTVENNTITVTPDPEAVAAAAATDKLEGKFVVTCGEKSATIDVTVKFAADCTHPFTSNVSWTLGKNAYDKTSGKNAPTAVINDTAVSDMLKLGTNKASGDFAITIPAGTKTLEFYALSWKGKECKITITGCTENPVEIDLNSNDGVSGNPPYTIATTDEEAYYSISVTDPAATSVTVSTSARAVFWGINTYSE